MFVGLFALGFMAFKHFSHKRKAHHDDNDFSGKQHKLGASLEAADEFSFGPTLSSFSVVLWGLVVAKAKAGVEAASKDSTASVGSLVKKAGIFSMLIAAASICQLMGQMNTANPVEAIEKATTSHKAAIWT